VFENRMLRRTVSPSGEKIAWGWVKLHNEKVS
jgi:hypothetical protein